MPMIFDEKISLSYFIIGWYIKNELEVKALSKSVNSIPKNITHNKSKEEYIISRYLVQYMANKYGLSSHIIKDKYGKPRLKNASISITHSHPYIFVGLHLEGKCIGIDVERATYKLLKIQNRVFNDMELICINNCLTTACYYWISKEATYKSLDNFYSFKNDMVVVENKLSLHQREFFAYYNKKSSKSIIHIRKVEWAPDNNVYLGYTVPTNTIYEL